jgi:hypothetical protein
MNINSPSVRKLGAILFWGGLIIGVIVGGAGVWASIEAILFKSSVSADSSLSSLSCPMFITSQETGVVKATLSNPHERPTEVAIRAYISAGYVTLYREEHMRVQLEPREKKQVEWLVSADDMVWRRLIMVRVYQFAGDGQPSRLGTCGIIVLGLPSLTGNLVTALLFGTALIFLLVGGYLWVAGNKELLDRKPDAPRTVKILVVTVLGLMVCGYMGWWLPGLLVFMAIVLVLATSLGILAFSSS